MEFLYVKNAIEKNIGVSKIRKYDNIIDDYMNWYAKKFKDDGYFPHNFFVADEYERKLQKAKIWKEILKLCYKQGEGVFWFVKFILGDMTYAGYTAPIRFNGLWNKWTKLAYQGDHIGVQCARQHGKSLYWSVVTPIYRMSLFEHYNILIESASEDQASSILGQVCKVIDNNEFLLSKRAKNAKWSTTELMYNGGKVRAKGIGSEVRGGTYDYIVIDDILRSDNKLSDNDIENFIDEELEPMILVRQGQIVLVGTKKSATDIFNAIEERIREGSGWQMYDFPAILDWEKKTLLCPDRFTWIQLMHKRKIMGHLKFEKEFMNKAYASGTQLFPHEFRQRAKELGRHYKLYSKAKIEESKDISYYMSADVARSGTASADYTVIFVIAYNHKDQTKRIVWVWRKKGLKISTQAEQIAEISRNFNNPPLLVEQNNVGQELIDVLIDNYNVNVESFTTGARGQAKGDLIRGLIVAFENEKLIIPTADTFSREKMEDVDIELSRFIVETTKAGNEIMKGSGKAKDDCVISLALANKCSQSYGYEPCATSIDTKHTTPLERYVSSGDIREVLNF